MPSTTHTVVGMTCEHCVRAVTEAISKLTGVTHVEVELETGSVTIESAEPIAAGAISSAVDEAGYELAP